MNRLRTAFALTLFLLAACSKEQPIQTQAAVEDDSTPVDGGTVIRRLQADVTTLNPILIASEYDHNVATYLFTPLLQLDASLLPSTTGSLTEKYEISADGKQYTFHLNPKATFSDGTPVRASDALFSLNKIVDPKSESAQFAGWFEQLDPAGTHAVDDHTLVVAFKQAVAPQTVAFSGVRVIPERVYSQGDFKSAFSMTAVGSGPYRLVRRVPGKEILLERRADFWGVKPHIQNVLFKVINSETTAWNAIKRGDIDETPIDSDTWLTQSRSPEFQKTIDFRRFYMLSYNYIAWNGRDPILADKRIRRALSMCVDLQSLINGLYHGTARAMNGPFTPDQWSYNPEVPVIQYNPTEARHIFSSIGWLDTDGDGTLDKNHQPLSLEMIIAGGSGTSVAFAQLLQSDLKKVGVDLKISPLDGSAFIQRLLAGNYQSAYFAWNLDPDPDPNAMYHSSQFPPAGQNFVFYKNPAADALIEQGRHELNHAKRVAIYRQFHAILAADQPYTWTIQVSSKWAVSKRIRNVKESRGWGLFLWYPGELDWWVAKK
ncbi:MAG: peptide/nickel transport system substrate-binding protein [Thermoanaerobaculia bacterium]|nr:peptide/nickel transport system substrate-binding protein [Thermoanaerobaculia bacterium]